MSRETPPPLPLEDEREKGRREGGATCALLTPSMKEIYYKLECKHILHYDFDIRFRFDIALFRIGRIKNTGV